MHSFVNVHVLRTWVFDAYRASNRQCIQKAVVDPVQSPLGVFHLEDDEVADGGINLRAFPPFAIDCYAAAGGGGGRDWRPRSIQLPTGGAWPSCYMYLPLYLYTATLT